MSKSFQDHFSSVATDYARYRPRYPEELFDWLANVAPSRELAWDCATGNGQAANALATRFRRVIATDASATQIAAAESRPGVEYRVAPAEQSGLDDASIDLLTVAQAFHWFDHPRFLAEACRVLRPGGVLAVWCYERLQVSHPQSQRALDHFYTETVGPYWPPERRFVEDGYRSIPLPYPDLMPPEFAMTSSLALEQLLGYLGTWSATRRYVAATGLDPLPSLRQTLGTFWTSGSGVHTVRWPLSLRLCRKPAEANGADSE